jgi:hypothetical protein
MLQHTTLSSPVLTFPDPCWVRYFTRHTEHVTRHTSHVIRHTSHVTRHTSHDTRHTTHDTCHTSHVAQMGGGSSLSCILSQGQVTRSNRFGFGGLGFLAEGLGFRDYGPWFSVQCLALGFGFSVLKYKLKVEGLGFRLCDL